MRTIKKRNLAILILAMAVMGTGMGAVYASTDDSGKYSPVSELVQAIADKFSLDAAEVQAVFDEQREVMKAEREKQRAEMRDKMEQEFADRLKQAVTDSELTQEQADLITKKRAEIQADREADKAEPETTKQITADERAAQRQERQAQMEELKAWAEKNNISQKHLMMGGGMGGGHRVHGNGLGIGE